MQMSIKKWLAFVMIIFFVGLAFAPAVDSNSIIIDKGKMFFQDNLELSVRNMEASSHYDYGYKSGKLLRSQYKLIDFLARFSKTDISNQYAENQIKFMEKYCPFLLEEFEGLSASTNIKLERLLYLKYFLNSYIGERCMSFACTGPATKNDETLLIQKKDTSNTFYKIGIMKLLNVYLERLVFCRLLWVKDNAGYQSNYKYIYLGIPVIFEWPLLNEKGLGFGASGTVATTNESRSFDTGPGITGEMLFALAMTTCKNVSEVAELYKSVERAGYIGSQINSLDAYCDAEGGILMIEQTHNYIVTVFGNSTEITGAPAGILWHVSHHQWLDPYKTGSVTPEEFPVSAMRADRTLELLETYYGDITLDICKKITRDHGGGFNPNGKDPADICRHSDKNGIGLEISTYIIDPKDLAIYICRGPPCRHIYRKYDFSKTFGQT